MKFVRSFSIKQKLVLIQLLTTFTVLLLYTLFNIVRDTRFYKESVNREVNSITALIGGNCVSSLHFLDPDAAADILGTLETEALVMNAWLFDAEGSLFAEYNKTRPEIPADIALADTVLRQGNHVVFAKPIVSDEEIIGSISIRYNIREYRRLVFKNATISLVIFLVGMAAALLMAVFTQKTISRPIMQLLESMKQISRTGDYSLRLSKQRDDEIGVLTDGISGMLEQIRVRDEEGNRIYRALHESEQKYRNLVEWAKDGIVILQNGVFEYVNPALLEMTGCTEKDLLGAPFADFLDEEAALGMASEADHKKAGKAGSAMYETRFKTKKGAVLDAEVNAGPIRYQGKPAELIIIRDTTRRKELEQELLQHQNNLEELVDERTRELAEANRQLLELDRMKSMFMASMSHELRTPLNSIIGFTGILLMGMAGELNDEQTHQLKMVKSSAEHLLALINDILDISKIESGKVELSIVAFDLIEVVEEVRKSVQPLAESKDLRLLIRGEKSVRMESDRRRIKQVLMNLVGNSIKFTETGSIEIDVRYHDPDMVMVAVKDTGIGIRQEELKKLFHPFQQIDMTSTKKYEGTGLGLYLSRKILNNLQGDIRVESTYNRGSTFTFHLPVRWREETAK